MDSNMGVDQWRAGTRRIMCTVPAGYGIGFFGGKIGKWLLDQDSNLGPSD